jgi:hypothetical protein
MIWGFYENCGIAGAVDYRVNSKTTVFGYTGYQQKEIDSDNAKSVKENQFVYRNSCALPANKHAMQ